MIKAKVKILAWPSYGSESVKPRFSIRGEYQVIQIVGQAAAVLDDHNQIYWLDLGLLSFVEIDGQRIDELDDFLKKNPDKDPAKAEERKRQEDAKAAKEQKKKEPPAPKAPEPQPEQPAAETETGASTDAPE